MASDLCLPCVLSVVSCSGLLCSWKPMMRDLLPASVPSCCVYGFRSVSYRCSACCVLFWPVVFLETSDERPPVYFSPVLLCLWLPICAFLVFCVLCPVPACCVPGNQCWETCLLQSCPVVSMASVSMICAVLVFRVLCPFPACCVPGNQWWETSCLLQSHPVVSMASALCRRGVLSVVSRSGLLCPRKPVLKDLLPVQSRPVVYKAYDLCRQGVLSVVCCSRMFCSWKPVLRDLLPASVASCCIYGFWSVPSWCFECCVLFPHVLFLETSVERPPACFSRVLLYLWLLICAVLVFWVLCPVPAYFVLGNQCWKTSFLLESHPVVSMASDLCRPGVLSVVSCSGIFCSWKPVLRDLLPAWVPSYCVYGFWSVPSWCFECCVLFRPVVVPKISDERPACFSPLLLCLWLLICAVRVFWVSFPFLACCVPGNQCWETSCLLQSHPVLYMASVLCSRVLCPVTTCCVPRNQWWETSCLLQSRPVVYMASDLCCRGVLSVLWIVSCFGLLYSWKPVLRDLLPASVPSCCVDGFWSVPSWCLSVVSCSGLLCSWKPVMRDSCLLQFPLLSGFWSVPSWYFEYCVLFRPAEWLHICWPHGQLWWKKSINRTIWEYLWNSCWKTSCQPGLVAICDERLFYSILFYSILFYSILFYSILHHKVSLYHCVSSWAPSDPGSHPGGV